MKKLKTTLLLLGSISLVSAMESSEEKDEPIINKYGWSVECSEYLRKKNYECATYDDFRDEMNTRRDGMYGVQEQHFRSNLDKRIKGTMYERYDTRYIPDDIKNYCIEKTLRYHQERHFNMLRSICYMDGVPHPFLGKYLAEEAFLFEYEDQLTPKYISKDGK